MNSVLWVEMFGPDADTAPRPQADAPLFDELFPYRVAGHAADARVRQAERDELIHAICGDDPLPVPSESASVRTFDEFLSAAVDEALAGPSHLEKIQKRADEVMRKATRLARECHCGCLRCVYGDCSGCAAEEKCTGWHSEHDTGIRNKALYDRHLRRALGLLEPLQKYAARRGWVTENLGADIGYAAHEIASGMMGASAA